MADKKITLKLDGKPLSLVRTPPSLVKMSTFLKSAPTDELFSAQELARVLKLSHHGMNEMRFTQAPELVDCTFKIGNTRYWGHPKAIAELKRQVG